jgi:predicted nucleic-acid-binding protein
MIAIDTNIIVRLLANDDPDQTARALRLLKEDRVFVASTVILETEWVLRSAYRADRGAIQQSLRKFLALPNVFIENERAVLQALEAHAAGMDFADALHLATAHGRATRFATFDQSLQRRAASQHGAIPVFEPQ